MRKLFFIAIAFVFMVSCQKDDEGLHLTEDVILSIESYTDNSVSLKWTLAKMDGFQEYKIVRSDVQSFSGGMNYIVKRIDDYFVTSHEVTDLGLESPIYFRIESIDENGYKQSNVVTLERDFETFTFNNSIQHYLYCPDSKQFVLSSGYSVYYIDCADDVISSGSFYNTEYHDDLYLGKSASGTEELWIPEYSYIDIYSLSTHALTDQMYKGYSSLKPFGVKSNGNFFMHDSDDEVYYYNRSTNNSDNIHYQYDWDIEGGTFVESQNALYLYHGYYNDYFITKAVLNDAADDIVSTEDYSSNIYQDIDYLEAINNDQHFVHGPGLRVSDISFSTTITIASSNVSCYAVQGTKIYYALNNTNEIKVYDIATGSSVESIETMALPVQIGIDEGQILVLEKDPNNSRNFVIEKF